MGKTSIKLFMTSSLCAMTSFNDVMNFISTYVLQYMQIILALFSFIMAIAGVIVAIVDVIKKRKNAHEILTDNIAQLNKQQKNLKDTQEEIKNKVK